MIPVKQTVTTRGRGNCVAACVASLLDLDIEEVPNFSLFPEPWRVTQEWLGYRGFYLEAFPVGDRDGECILGGQSPRGGVGHAVVGVIEDGKARMVHDPHPEGTGLAGEPEFSVFLVPLER